MKRILMAVVLFAVSAPAFALDLPGVKLPTPEAKMASAAPVTAFEQLEAAFKAGTAPTEADLTGYHSGRIYRKVNPNDAKAEMLVGRQTTATGLPADLDPAEFRIFIVHAAPASAPTDYFDELTAEKRKEINESLAELTGVTVKFGTEEASVIPPQIGVLTVRKNGEYLIVRLERGKAVTAYYYFSLKAQ